jgi:hypothetical protein
VVADIGIPAGAPGEAVAGVIGDGVLELAVEIERSIEEPAAGAAGPVTGERARRGFEDPRMVREAEVVVRPQHDPFPPLDHHHRVFRLGDGLEVRVQPCSLHLASLGEVPALVEQRDVLERLCVHGASVEKGVRKRNPTSLCHGMA